MSNFLIPLGLFAFEKGSLDASYGIACYSTSSCGHSLTASVCTLYATLCRLIDIASV